ncbi:MAG: hypothetical protein ACH253_02300 [Candidatus Thiodiazotropha sp.]
MAEAAQTQRDRLSNLESLLATLQRYQADAKVIVLLDKKHLDNLAKVKQRYPVHAVLTFPLNESGMQAVLENL